MLTFLPALILLLLHGPSTFERPIGQAGSQADIGARALPTPAFVARHNRAWIAELLSRIPNDAFLAALGIGDSPETVPDLLAPTYSVPSYSAPIAPIRGGGVQRDRDGPARA